MSITDTLQIGLLIAWTVCLLYAVPLLFLFALAKQVTKKMEVLKNDRKNKTGAD